MTAGVADPKTFSSELDTALAALQIYSVPDPAAYSIQMRSDHRQCCQVLAQLSCQFVQKVRPIFKKSGHFLKKSFFAYIIQYFELKQVDFVFSFLQPLF